MANMTTIRKLASAITLAATTTLLSSAALAWGWGQTVTGSGTAKTDIRNVSGFTGLGVSVPAKVAVIQGDKEGVTLEGDDNIVALVETEVESGKLKLRFSERNMNVKTKVPLKATVYVKTLESLSVSGSGDVTSATLKSTNFKASIAGSGDINVGGVEADKVKVGIAGSGDATVWAKSHLNVSVAGSGDVKYYGNPEVKKSVFGSGSAKKLADSPPAPSAAN